MAIYTFCTFITFHRKQSTSAEDLRKIALLFLQLWMRTWVQLGGTHHLFVIDQAECDIYRIVCLDLYYSIQSWPPVHTHTESVISHIQGGTGKREILNRELSRQSRALNLNCRRRFGIFGQLMSYWYFLRHSRLKPYLAFSIK